VQGHGTVGTKWGLYIHMRVADSWHPDDGGDTFLRNSVVTTVTRSHVPKDDILHIHRRESLKSYIALTGWTL
jgi:hypothetical protein